MDRDSEFLEEGSTGGGSQGNGGYGTSGARGTLARLALEALADADFYKRLKEDPQKAAESIGIKLSESEAEYLKSQVHWSVVDAHLAEMREGLHLGVMQAGPLW